MAHKKTHAVLLRLATGTVAFGDSHAEVLLQAVLPLKGLALAAGASSRPKVAAGPAGNSDLFFSWKCLESLGGPER